MEEIEKELPINKGRIIVEQAKGTIKSVLDAIVELITNCDDSFSLMEQSNIPISEAKIQIRVVRKTGGVCQNLIIVDNASGMDFDQLMRAIEFGGETSGFQEGKKARGFFGRGLKESIIALGEGTILTRKNNVLSGVRIRLKQGPNGLMPYYKIITDKKELNEGVNMYLKEDQSGTVVNICNIHPQYKIAEYRTLDEQITKHYQLRYINSNPKRKVKLYFSVPDSKKGDIEADIKFIWPSGNLKLKKEIEIKGEKALLEVMESDVSLDSPQHYAFGLAGILISTEGSILENTLFKFNNDEAGLYFYGSVDVPGIARRLREREVLVSPNRNGLDWKHEYLEELKSKIENELSILVAVKKKQLNQNAPNNLSSKNKELIKKLRELMNDLAKEEGMDWETPIDPGTLDALIIKPEICDVAIHEPRELNIYLPKEIAEIYPIDKISLSIDNPDIEISQPTLPFREHKTHPEILVGRFSVSSSIDDEDGIITCNLGDKSAIAIVHTVEKIEPAKRKKKKLSLNSRGFLRDIQTDERDNPDQRVFFDDHMGEIRIFIKFPGVNNYLKSGLSGVETPEGKVMLAELVTEAFCRAIAQKGLMDGKFLTLGSDRDSYIYSYNRVLFDLQKKYADKFHKFVNLFYNS